MGLMKVLLTGSNGLLGQKLVHKLRVNDKVDLLASSLGENRISVKEGYSFQPLDISDYSSVMNLCKEFQPDVIINTAAMTNVDACESDQEKCWRLNVDAVKYLIEAAELNQAHLIQLSTDFIFDGEAGPYKETDAPNPLSYYGKSKLASEEIVKQAKTSWAIVRTIIVYGIVEKMSRSNVVLWAKSALESGDSINVVNDQFRMPTLAEDLADACISIAELRAEGVYHVSGKDFMSIVELVRRVAKFYGISTATLSEISSSSLNQAAKRPPKTGFVLDKAYNQLNYKPHTFEQGLEIVSQQLKDLA